MMPRRLFLALLFSVTSCTWSLAQEQGSTGPQFLPLEATTAAPEPTQAAPLTYFSISGAINNPGVYEFEQGSITVRELVERAGMQNGTEAAVVRPLSFAEVAAQRSRMTNVDEMPLLQSSHMVFPPADEILQSGDLVILRPQSPNIQQAVHQPATTSTAGKVSLVLANLIGRPIHALMNPEQATVIGLARYLGISDELVEKHAIVVLRSSQNDDSLNPGRMLATDPLPAGTILMFDPTLVQLDKLNTESLEKLTQTQKPIRVAANPNEDIQSDVPQSNLMTEYQDENIVPEQTVEAIQTETINTPLFVNEPTPAPEEEFTSGPQIAPPQMEVANNLPLVENLSPPTEGSGMYDGGSNLIDVETLLADNQRQLPTLDETPVAPASPMTSNAEFEVAELPAAPEAKARNQASLWVISVLVVMIASVLGYYLLNNRATTAKKQQPRKKTQRTPVKRPNMLENMDDPKVAAYRTMIEQKKKMFASAQNRDEDLQIDALINDYLPVTEEEMVITRTFNLPGIGQSFRIDPANTELQGPHFRQAAKVNNKGKQTVSANVGMNQSNSAAAGQTRSAATPPAPTAEGPGAARPEPTRPARKAYHTIHKGGSQHFGSGK